MSDLDTTADDTVTRTVQANWLFARLTPWIIDSLSAEQKEALHKVIDDPTWDLPPVNIRMHVPFFRWRYYMTLVAGEEKRSYERRTYDRHRYLVRTIANIFFSSAFALCSIWFPSWASPSPAPSSNFKRDLSSSCPSTSLRVLGVEP